MICTEFQASLGHSVLAWVSDRLAFLKHRRFKYLRPDGRLTSWSIFFFQKSIPFLSREASLSDSINFPFPHMFPSHRVTWIWISEWKETGLLRDGQWPSESEGSRALLLCLEVGTTELAWSTQRCCSHRAEEAPGSHQALSRAQGPLGFLSLLIHDGNHYFHVPIVLSAIHTF